MFRFPHHCRVKELRSTFQHRINSFQKLNILSILIMLPKMSTKPGTTGIGSPPGGMFTGSGIVPDIRHHVKHPTLSMSTVKSTGSLFSRGDKTFYKRSQRLVKFRKAGLFKRPVIHLDINIGMIIAIPRRFYSICPQSLQIRRQATRTGAADK